MIGDTEFHDFLLEEGYKVGLRKVRRINTNEGD